MRFAPAPFRGYGSAAFCRNGATLSDIFKEVEEDLRRDRAQRLWETYGNYVIALAVLIVAGTAGWVFWQDHSRKQAEAGAAQYVAALDQSRSADAAASGQAFAGVVRDGPAGYASLARLHEAAALSRAGEPARAAALYQAIAADTRVERELRDAASILAALNAVDVSDPATIERQVAPLATPGNPWRHLAWEIGAVAALKGGNTEQARGYYTRIADDPEAPPALRARAAEMLAALAG